MINIGQKIEKNCVANISAIEKYEIAQKLSLLIVFKQFKYKFKSLL